MWVSNVFVLVGLLVLGSILDPFLEKIMLFLPFYFLKALPKLDLNVASASLLLLGTKLSLK